MLSQSQFSHSGRGYYEYEDEHICIHIGEFAAAIQMAYPGKLDEIAGQFAADTSFRQFFPHADAKAVATHLGKPAIRILSPADGVITYAGHTFDDIHLLDIEFSGALEKFFYSSIDG